MATSRSPVIMPRPGRHSLFQEYSGGGSAASSRSNSDSSISSTLSPTRSKSSTWQSPGGIWGVNTIGSGITNTARDISRSCTKDSQEFSDAPSGSGALAASSEADPWVSHTWNHTNSASTSMQSNSENTTSTPPARHSMPNVNQHQLREASNGYQQHSRTMFSHEASLPRSQPKSNLDPSSGPFNFAQSSLATYDEKENVGSHISNTYASDVGLSKYLPMANLSRDISRSLSNAIDTIGASDGCQFGDGNTQMGLMGSHTRNSSIHSQPMSLSPHSRSIGSQIQNLRFDLLSSDAELGEKMAGFGIPRDVDQAMSMYPNHRLAPHYTSKPPQTNPHMSPQTLPFVNSSAMWNEGINAANMRESYQSQLHNDSRNMNKMASTSHPHNRQNMSCNKSRRASEQFLGSGPVGMQSGQALGHAGRRISCAPFNHAQNYVNAPNFNTQFPTPIYDLPPTSHKSGLMGLPYDYPMLVQSYHASQPIFMHPSKGHDTGFGIRSTVLEDFRANLKSNKKFELKDIYNHIIEFSGDQHGSRFIQTKLETASSDEKERVFLELKPNVLQLTTDVFGNYVIQKLFEHGNQAQKRVLAEQLKNHVVELSLQMYGCRVVQKALEYVLADQQASLVKELQMDILKCVQDQNGNHVVQKAIERVPNQHVQFILDAFRGQVETLATHPYGCRVIQRILAFCKPEDQSEILKELHECSQKLIMDQYGNYVIQHVIQHGRLEDRDKIINLVLRQLLNLSNHKFASNVVEKSIIHGTEKQRRAMVSHLTAIGCDGTSPLQLIMKDQFGNYVIQKLLAQLQGVEKVAFLNDMKPQLLQLKKHNYGKQIAVIEKLLFTEIEDSSLPKTCSPMKSQRFTMEIDSRVATPMLTNAQNSPQSNGRSSANISIIDDSIKDCEDIFMKFNLCPDLVVDSH
ncbi:BgTH12-01989 [Blumeria graminis f. sp. triticale]|uniref:Pumilio homology domain family member 3 n=1 Tax=Blumeria graminis f. sp. triticale TaxID=1689686 RepID=A0A9W4GFD6_BLUGR|nr:BgTH12-01989 [Blumeria graminis f. sp. triticale]